jgi:hypothetical protein
VANDLSRESPLLAGVVRTSPGIGYAGRLENQTRATHENSFRLHAAAAGIVWFAAVAGLPRPSRMLNPSVAADPANDQHQPGWKQAM